MTAANLIGKLALVCGIGMSTWVGAVSVSFPTCNSVVELTSWKDEGGKGLALVRKDRCGEYHHADKEE